VQPSEGRVYEVSEGSGSGSGGLGGLFNG
jgi:hypothetical protein